MIHNMNMLKGKKGYFAINIDLAKGYDMMSWPFVNNVLIELGIEDKLRYLIMDSISFVKMCVL